MLLPDILDPKLVGGQSERDGPSCMRQQTQGVFGLEVSCLVHVGYQPSMRKAIYPFCGFQVN